jgi:hypothetical protein
MQPFFRYPDAMVFKEIELEYIDLSDEIFRITENLNSPPLLESLRDIGLLNPVIVTDGMPSIVVCGFRRLHALKQLGFSHALARVIPEDSHAKLFQLALSDNLSHRHLDPLEKARALFKLKNEFQISVDVLLRVYLPLLSLSPHENVLRSYIRLNEIHPGLRNCLSENRLTLSSLEMLAQMPDQAQARISALMDKIRLSASMQKKLFDLMKDLAVIGGSQPTGKDLDSPEALAAINDVSLSPFQKGEKLYGLLYRTRNPRLSGAEEQFRDKKKLLGLPGSIKVSADPFFENPGIRVEFEALNAQRFRELAAALQKAAQTEAIEELFKI